MGKSWKVVDMPQTRLFHATVSDATASTATALCLALSPACTTNMVRQSACFIVLKRFGVGRSKERIFRFGIRGALDSDTENSLSVVDDAATTAALGR